MKRNILVAVTLLLATSLARPSTAAGQLTIEGTCVGSVSLCSPFVTTLESDAPLFLERLSLSFISPGWSFDSPAYVAEDAFGSFAGVGTLSGGGSSIFLDFFFDAGFLIVDPAAGASISVTASGAELPSLEWEAIDDFGERHAGTAVPTVAEPGSFGLLATGLMGLIALCGRRRSVLGRFEKHE